MKKWILFFGFVAAISQAAERYATNSFTAQGMNCSESVQSAQFQCGQWLSDFSSKHQVVEPPQCPAQYCTCSGEQFPESTCVGWVKYDDMKPCTAPIQYGYQPFNATGMGCQDAIHQVMTQNYQWESQESSSVNVLGMHWEQPTCSGQGLYAQAYVNTTVTYQQCP